MKNEIVQILENRGINGFRFPGGTDKASDHSYDTYYCETLKPYQDKEIKLLEIGVQFGGSALLWYDFLPKSNLILVDIRNNVNQKIFESMSSDRYSFHEMDAFNKESVFLPLRKEVLNSSTMQKAVYRILNFETSCVFPVLHGPN